MPPMVMRVGIAVILVTSTISCTRGRLHDAEHAQASVQQLAGQRAAAADRWFDLVVHHYEAGEPLTPEFVGQLVDAARQRAIARADASEEPPARRAAYAAYRDFCGEVLRRIERGPEHKPRQAAHLRYAMADAEWRMAGAGQ
jgi:hypothetical protein